MKILNCNHIVDLFSSYHAAADFRPLTKTSCTPEVVLKTSKKAIVIAGLTRNLLKRGEAVLKVHLNTKNTKKPQR
jgi:hypothetical protein